MFRLAEPLSSIQSRLCEQSKFLKAGADSGTIQLSIDLLLVGKDGVLQ
jgi:hypothetical protein